ncbi:MAG: hypothetical protein FK734_07535 [Asgard group archaeon]|nr:hypothetical protein [Asgard group archaeon]
MRFSIFYIKFFDILIDKCYEVTSLSHEEEDKPIYNIGFFSKQTEDEKKDPKDVLQWNKNKLIAYIRGVFDGRGVIYTNDKNDMIISLQHHKIEKLEIYQKALQMLDIYSFIYYPQDSSDVIELFIVGKRNVYLFNRLIGIDYPEDADIFYNFWKKIDWED